MHDLGGVDRGERLTDWPNEQVHRRREQYADLEREQVVGAAAQRAVDNLGWVAVKVVDHQQQLAPVP